MGRDVPLEINESSKLPAASVELFVKSTKWTIHLEQTISPIGKQGRGCGISDTNSDIYIYMQHLHLY